MQNGESKVLKFGGESQSHIDACQGNIIFLLFKFVNMHMKLKTVHFVKIMTSNSRVSMCDYKHVGLKSKTGNIFFVFFQ